MDDLRKLWMETTSEISKESQTLSHEQEQTRAQINQKREVVKQLFTINLAQYFVHHLYKL